MRIDRTAWHADRAVVAPAAGAWAAGAGCTLLSPRTSALIGVGAIAGAVVLRGRTSGAALLAIGVALGALVSAWHVHGLRSGPLARLAERRAEVDVVARLVRDPVPTTTQAGARLTITDATVTSILDGGWHRGGGPVLVLSYGSGWDGLLPGQRVEVVGRLAPPRRGDDVAAVLDARAPPVLIGHPPLWQRAAGRIRAGLRSACRGLPPDLRGLVPGLVDGDVSAEPSTLTTDMRTTGLTHLQAVSGENVSLVLGVVLALARRIGLRRRSRIAVSVLALLAFVVLARPSPSVLRAAVMGGVVLLALSLGRRLVPTRALAFAVLVLVAIDPFLARSVGFVLSVAATAAILLIAPSWTDRLAARMPRPVATAIAVPAAAQLACTPILVLVFGQLTPYAIPANLLAAPAVAPATIVGVLAAVVASAAVAAAVPLAWIAALPAWVIAAAAHVFAALPGAGVRWSNRWTLVVGLVVVVVFARRVRRSGVSADREILGAWPR
jgi:competence protein ComEC